MRVTAVHEYVSCRSERNEKLADVRVYWSPSLAGRIESLIQHLREEMLYINNHVVDRVDELVEVINEPGLVSRLGSFMELHLPFSEEIVRELNRSSSGSIKLARILNAREEVSNLIRALSETPAYKEWLMSEEKRANNRPRYEYGE